MEYEKAVAFAQANAAAQNAYSAGLAGATQAQAPELQSANILNRLKNLRHSLRELNASTDSAAEKIVGSMPTPLNSGAGALVGVKAEREPGCFLDALSQIVTDLETVVEGDLRENINRFHRFF